MVIIDGILSSGLGGRLPRFFRILDVVSFMQARMWLVSNIEREDPWLRRWLQSKSYSSRPLPTDTDIFSKSQGAKAISTSIDTDSSRLLEV